MPAKATGSVRLRTKGFQAMVFLGEGRRAFIDLPTCKDQQSAESRAAVLSSLAAQMRKAGLSEKIEQLVARVATYREEQLPQARLYVENLCKRGLPDSASATAPAKTEHTFQSVGQRWTSGELARQHPDHIRKKKDADIDKYRLERHVYPIVGNVPIKAFTLEHAEQVMSALPVGDTLTGPRAARGLEVNSRRHVAQLLGRIMNIAVYPLKLRESSPIPRGWIPKRGARKALGWLFPDEEALLLGCTDVPLGYRVLYGFLAREGPRVSEALALERPDLDLVRGFVSLDENKTDDPRMWALNASVVRAMKAWFKLWPSERVFDIVYSDQHLADRLREHLRIAGVTRPALFERSKARRRIWIHDFRALFITLSLAHGKSETWVSDRTGHKSSDQIHNYKRPARAAAEMRLPELTPMDEAIPELRGVK